LTQIFVESYADFEVAHLSVLTVRRLPYSEIPTLKYARDLDPYNFKEAAWNAGQSWL